jgi:hypothetical protein
MFSNRLFNVFIVIAVVIIVALTVREASATAAIISERDEAKGAMTLDCASLPSRYSIHTRYVQEADMWIVRTENGPTGVEGGLIELLSTYRTCSR